MDLETTGRLAQKWEIVQVAATFNADGKKSVFNKCVLPEGTIEAGASAITGTTIGHRSGTRELLKQGKPVDTLTLQESLKSFLAWLPCDTVLVAHNGLNFDAIVLLRHIQVLKLDTAFKGKVVGFADSLPLLKAAIPGRAS